MKAPIAWLGSIGLALMVGGGIGYWMSNRQMIPPGLPEVVDAMGALADAKLTALEREAMVARDAARIALTYGNAQ